MNDDPNTTYAAIFAALGNARRLEVFDALLAAGRGGHKFGALASALGIPHSSLSHHVQELDKAGLLEREAQGTSTILRLNLTVLAGALAHFQARCCAADPTETR
ncbi:MAG: helix-turn-helix transcriptional regulator [Paracoccaceae bacterium]